MKLNKLTVQYKEYKSLTRLVFNQNAWKQKPCTSSIEISLINCFPYDLTWTLESLSTYFAFKRTYTGMNQLVRIDLSVSEKLFVTNFTREPTIVRMSQLMFE